jgi:hypothetical protein
MDKRPEKFGPKNRRKTGGERMRIICLLGSPRTKGNSQKDYGLNRRWNLENIVR